MSTDQSAESQRTTDHETIRQWAEERGGHPATVADTGDEEEPGILRIDFEDDDDDLERISWDAFFEAFEANDLAMVYQDATDEGEESRFAKFVSREE